jgi:hypothetical protein
MTTNPKPYITKASIVDEIYSLDQALPKYKLSKLVRSELSKRLEILKRGVTKQVDNLLLGDLSSSDEDCEDPVSAKPRLQIKQKKVKIQEPEVPEEEPVYEKNPSPVSSQTSSRTLATDPAPVLKSSGKPSRKQPTAQQNIRFILSEYKKDVDNLLKPWKSKARSMGLDDYEFDQIVNDFHLLRDEAKCEINLILDESDISDSFFTFIESKLDLVTKMVEKCIE